MTTELFILTRAVHFGACLLFFGIFAFDRFVVVSVVARGQSKAADYWKSCVRWLALGLLPIVFISGIAWFALVAMTMSGQPLQADILKTVWTQTQFGTVWKWRLILWLAAVGAAFFHFFKSQTSFCKKLVWLEFFLGGGLLGSLAWTGHGQESSHWHLLADVLHLLVAGFWPTSLLPFALLLRKLRRASEPTDWFSIMVLVRRFSGLSLASVGLLTVTGLVNSWYLVGSPTNLFQQTYGRWLCVKIILVILAVAVGGMNLLRLKPRLTFEKLPSPDFSKSAAQLQFNVQMEILLGAAIILIVAILGILPPAIR